MAIDKIFVDQFIKVTSKAALSSSYLKSITILQLNNFIKG